MYLTCVSLFYSNLVVVLLDTMGQIVNHAIVSSMEHKMEYVRSVVVSAHASSTLEDLGVMSVLLVSGTSQIASVSI